MAKKRSLKTDHSTSSTPKRSRRHSSNISEEDFDVNTRTSLRSRLTSKKKKNAKAEVISTPDLVRIPVSPSESVSASVSKCPISKQSILRTREVGVLEKHLVMPSVHEEEDDLNSKTSRHRQYHEDNENGHLTKGSDLVESVISNNESDFTLPVRDKTKKFLTQVKVVLFAMWLQFMVFYPSACAMMSCSTSLFNLNMLRCGGKTVMHVSDITLKEYLQHDEGYYVAMGPAFFGFYAYFGALTAIDDAELLLIPGSDKNRQRKRKVGGQVNGVVGASAGAMAAVLVASGKQPSDAADFACSVQLSDFADPPGILGTFKGNQFEVLMSEFLTSESISSSISSAESHINIPKSLGKATKQVKNIIDQSSRAASAFNRGVLAQLFNRLPKNMKDETLSKEQASVEEDNYSDVKINPASNILASSIIPLLEESKVPVAVTTFDLLRMKTKILTRGNSAKASRASSTFPGLFQPVPWYDEMEQSYSILIDGGVQDRNGLLGLTVLDNDDSGKTHNKKRVLHILLGGKVNDTTKAIKDPRDLSFYNIESIVTVKLVNIPKSGPLSMKKGPSAVKLARLAMDRALNQPLLTDREGSYVVIVDASELVP